MKYKSVKGLLKSDESLIPVTFIDKLEDILHGFLGIVLFLISVLAAGYSLLRLIETRPFFPLGMIQAINDILFVVIILEIMRTVIVRFTDGIFQLDNFLIIGVIAAVRHILTVGASLTMEKEKTTENFNRSLMEMGVNTGIVLALVFALFLSRAARARLRLRRPRALHRRRGECRTPVCRAAAHRRANRPCAAPASRTLRPAESCAKR